MADGKVKKSELNSSKDSLNSICFFVNSVLYPVVSGRKDSVHQL
jgi:hypothetical protein